MNEAVRAVFGGRPDRDKKKKGEEPPASAVAYLNLCFLREQEPPAQGKVREVETLAHVLDMAADGGMGGAMGIAFGWFQAPKVSDEDGGCGNAEHLEVDPQLRYSATSEGERQAAAKLEAARQKRQKLIQRTTSGGTDGGSPGGGMSPPGGRKWKFQFQLQYRPPWMGWRGRGRKGSGKGRKGGR